MVLPRLLTASTTKLLFSSGYYLGRETAVRSFVRSFGCRFVPAETSRDKRRVTGTSISTSRGYTEVAAQNRSVEGDRIACKSICRRFAIRPFEKCKVASSLTSGSLLRSLCPRFAGPPPSSRFSHERRLRFSLITTRSSIPDARTIPKLFRSRLFVR